MISMKSASLHKLIKSVIAESEDEFGYVFEHSGSLYDIFVKPVTDAGKVAGAELKKTAARGKHLIHTSLEAILSTLLPFLDADYDKIDAAAEQKIEKAESAAGDAYDEIKHALNGSDAIMFSLLYSPAAMITLAAGSKIADKLKKAFGLHEAVKVDDERLQDLSAAVRAATQEKFRACVSRAKQISSAKDLAELSAIFGKKTQVKNSTGVDAAKQKLISAFAQKLSDERSALIKRGVPKGAPIVKDYDKTISFISRVGDKYK